MIFGRHHSVFDFARFIQVEQVKGGRAIFHITTSVKDIQKVEQSMNLNNLNIDYKIVLRDHPIVSKSGKVQLLVKENGNSLL